MQITGEGQYVSCSLTANQVINWGLLGSTLLSGLEDCGSDRTASLMGEMLVLKSILQQMQQAN